MDSQSHPLNKPSNHHLIPVAITVVSLVLIIVIGIYTALSYQKRPSETQQQLVAKQDSRDYSFPRITVDSWKVEKSAAISPKTTTATIYAVDSSYGKAEFDGLLFHFFTANSTKETEKSMRAFSDQNGSSMLYMQKDTGSFLYKSSAGIPLASSAASLDESKKILAFAQDALRDDTIAQFATYHKKSNPGITYYELHRDWNRLGFPLLNLFGVLNLKGTSLRDLTLYKPTNQVAPDPDITQTSDKTDGQKRANDFNTVTVGVRDSKIVDVISNMRLFPSVTTRPSSNKIISYEDAVKKLTANEYSRLYTSPAGTGAVDREKMYPQNKATLSEATVTESTIAYLEELPGTQQDTLAPYYVFRGTGMLSSGYRVTFVATVPATAHNVLGVATGFDPSQKQGTFTIDGQGQPSPSPITTPTQTTQTSAQTTTTHQQSQLPPTSQICDEDPQSVNQLYNVQVDDVSGTTLGQFDIQPPHGTPMITTWFGPQWYAVSKANHDINQLNTVIDLAVNKAGLKRDTSGNQSGPTTVRDYNELLTDWEIAAVSCPVRLTGRSPSLFVYSNIVRHVNIALPHSLTYADPPAANYNWQIITPTAYLYYEYAPVVFSQPVAGWRVEASHLGHFAATISRQLALTTAESERLSYELRNAAGDIDSNTLNVSLIDRHEIDQEVPVTLSPAPTTIHRIHFLLTPGTQTLKKPPLLAPLDRSGYTVVELGATAN